MYFEWLFHNPTHLFLKHLILSLSVCVSLNVYVCVLYSGKLLWEKLSFISRKGAFGGENFHRMLIKPIA